MHLDEEQVQRLMHGELEGSAAGDARGHIAECAECRDRLAEAEREETEVHALLRELDDPTPYVESSTVTMGARFQDSGLLRWAAGFVLAAGVAGAAYAVPGSPLPAWTSAAIEWIGGRRDESPSAPAREPAPDPLPAGVAIAPGERLVILFAASQRTGQAIVSLTDGAEVVVRAPSGAAIFTSEQERLLIDNPGSTASFDIEVPHAAPRVEIRVDGKRVFLKEGPLVVTPEFASAPGLYAVPLTSPEP